MQGSLGMLAMAFSPCLSRERRFQGSPRMPKSGPLRMLDAGFDPSRLPFSRLGPPGQGSLLGIRVSDPGVSKGLRAYILISLISALAFPFCLSRKRQNLQNDKFGYLWAFSSTSTVERAHLSSKLEFWRPWAPKGGPCRTLLRSILPPSR